MTDADKDRAGAMAKEYGVEAFDSTAAMLDGAALDAVIVALPNDLHEEIVAQAADAGVHVLCQKPLAHTLESAKRIADRCIERGVLLQVGFNQRFWKPVRLARRAIEEGVIGEPHAFRSVYSEAWNVYPASTQYRYNLQQSGGASILDLAIHRIDLARYLLGEFSEVCAAITHSALPVPVDDNVILLCKFRAGAQGVISSDRFSPQVSNATDIYGGQGTIHVSTETINPFQSVPLAISSALPVDELPDWLIEGYYPPAWWEAYKPGTWITLSPPRVNPYLEELEAFARAVTGEQELEITGEDGLRAQEIVTASYRSVRTHGWVSVPLDDLTEPMPTY